MNWKREKWRKLYVREEGTFAQLPLMVRALAGQLLKLCDDNGNIHIGGTRTFEEVVAFRFGATASDRRFLKIAIPALFEDGFLSQKGNCVSIVNFVPAQARATDGDSQTAGGARRDNVLGRGVASEVGGAQRGVAVDESATSGERLINESVTSDARPANENLVKCPEPLETGVCSKEERREEEKRNEVVGGSAAPLPPAADDPIPLVDNSPVVMSMPYRDGRLYPVTEAMLAKYREDYPAIGRIEDSLRNCRVFLENNPQKRSANVRGMRQRITDWLKGDEKRERDGTQRPGLWPPKRDVRIGHGRAEDIKHTVSGVVEDF